jgi:hypothetical protein
MYIIPRTVYTIVFNIDIDDRALRQLQENLKKLGGERSVPLADLLTPEFMATYTSFPDLNSFFEASGLFPRDADSKTISSVLEEKRAALDAWTAKESSCKSWDDLLATAGREYIRRELFRGLN